MINFNGRCLSGFENLKEPLSLIQQFRDSFSIYIPFQEGELLLWESFYFHLMAQLRQRRFSIPDEYTPDFFKSQANQLLQAQRGDYPTLQICCFRSTPASTDAIYGEASFYLQFHSTFLIPQNPPVLEVDLYKDQFAVANVDTRGGTTPEPISSIAQIFAYENGWDAALLLNADMHLALSSRGSLYLGYPEGNFRTPEVESGGLKHPLTRAWEDWLATQNISCEASLLAPFELQQAKNVSLWDPKYGFAIVQKYRKTNYESSELEAIYQNFRKSVLG